MDKEGKTMKYRNILKKRILAGLLAGAAACAAAPALAASGVVPNTQLPQDGNFVAGSGTIGAPSNGQMTITQNTQNGVIKWDSFNVGANATVNFEKGESYNGGDRFNTLNYVNQANGMSQIYGAISAAEGNIYIVNPAGVEISNSAQINVGSLYVSNRNMTDDVLKGVNDSTDITKLIQSQAMNENPDAVLMSLGNVNADHVTFDGNRIVIDTERLKTGDEKMAAGNIKVNTTDAGSVVIGYDAYDKENETYAGKDKKISDLATVMENGTAVIDLKGYMWVEDVEQLQKIDTNLGGNYALRNSIDATATQDWNDKKGFKPIGIDSTGKVIVENSKYGFHGNFDGLSYNIFNLNINRADAVNVGLFGVLHEAEINNVTFVGGAITGGNVVGSLAGAVLGNTHVNNVMNSASVTGGADVGGIIGYSGDEIDQVEDSDKPITVGSADAHFSNMVNTGTVVSSGTSNGNGGTISDAGGLIGNLYQGTLDGTSYNLGSVTGEGHNVGGLVGHAYASKLGDGTNLIYNRLDVTGAYNVGGIVGQMEGTTVQNAENSGNVLANRQVTGTYIYHTDHSSTGTNSDGLAEVDVYIANAGGIAGSASGNSTITDVLNTGNVSSASKTFTETVTNVNGNDTKDVTSTYYTAGNVGGIVGSAVNTNITNATNRENEIRGAHNVGGIAGYFANSESAPANDKYVVTNGVNDGGDIMATGAWNGQIQNNIPVFIKETIRGSGRESFTVGNMGGIVGYMDGNNVYIASSANRGTVHTLEPENPEFVGSASKAANAGGIVGKIDRSNGSTLNVDTLKTDYSKAAVSNSYNTGDVMGYTGIGGIAGMMYNGEIAGSYNLGYLRTTRQSDTKTDGSIDPINMGGIVGDTTEESSAWALLYDVYNKGQIGDKNYDYFGRHVGGIVGRLSGTVEKAYNTGAIYNGYNVVGGIAGWMYTGSINNAFNTGNITVVNNNHSASSQVGGIVGAADVSIANITLSNVYNLGTLRSFWVHKDDEKSHSSLGGIIGDVYRYNSAGGDHPFNGDHVTIKNAYTTGNLYIDDAENGGKIGSIWANAGSGHFEVENTHYIQPDTQLGGTFADLEAAGKNNANYVINFAEKDQKDRYHFDDGITAPDTTINGGNVEEEGFAWRIYAGSTPILNAFLPNAEDYFSGEKEGIELNLNGIGSIQYGTAYDPLLTIVKANGQKDNLDFDWQKLGINNDAGLAVYGAGLTLNDFMSTGGSGYFGGLIYSDGALTIKADTDGGNPHSITGDVALGSASKLYGSSVTIKADGQVTIYGSVIATGNVQDGTSWDGKQYTETLKNTDGSISITGGSVDIYGQLTSADGQSVKVPGINGMATGWKPGTVSDPHVSMSDIGDRFGYTTQPSDTLTQTPGNISITANDAEDGHVNIYYGNKGEGIVTTGGDLTVTASGDIYMDSDLDVGGNITFDAPGEKVLDLTNIGKVRGESFMADITAALQQAGIVIANPDEVENKKDAAISAIMDILSEKYEMGEDSAKTMANSIVGTLTTEGEGVDGLAEQVNVNRLHEFLDHFQKPADGTNGFKLTFKNGENGSAADSSKITVDMWDEEINEGKGGFNLDKFDIGNDKFVEDLNHLNFKVAGDTDANAQKYTYIWVSTGEQLKGIQQYKNIYSDSNILTYNFALKNDINASGVNDYKAIASGEGESYTGIFDGRDNRIIGLDTTKKSDGTTQTLTNAGIFGTIGTREDGEGKIHTGTVEDLRVYSGTFTGTDNAGAVAGVNNGNISNVTTFGNVVESANHAGGIAGENSGIISGASAIGTSTVTADKSGGVAGGIAGTNSGTISDSSANSAVDSSSGGAAALGGVAGVNEGTLDNVDSLGVTTGIYQVGEHNPDVGTQYSDNVGGIAGTNSGTVTNVYNESIVSGRDNVGGILGVNNGASVSNVANASSVTGEAGTDDASDYVGGLVGNNKGSITNGRNNGEITGNNYVGGLVGNNQTVSTLKNLVNDESAAITGDNYVGGIAGANAGEITADEGNDNLINRGTITGVQYVGGVAGKNTGTITNTNNDVDLHVKKGATDAKYFGGVAGINTGDGRITDATNHANVSADGASHVGGVVGKNDGVLSGMNGNYGNVSGKDFVGGVVGENSQALAGVEAVNQGNVTAAEGGAGGIFAVNKGEITDSTLTSSGSVTGTTGSGVSGTGGIFGVNEGNIINSTLENKGYTDDDGVFHDSLVTGTSNTGGLIGINTGNVTTSSLKNEADIKGEEDNVSNIGGLIGQNSGDITGGRDENDGYYQYQIYNNGTITVEGKGSNIGGLFGTNEGKVTAGYNTGAVIAENSTNVGGIAGTNSGTLDQVFNTVITGVNGEGKTQYGAITGSTNVGGIAGTNTKNGTISNAYNTTAIAGTVSGAIAGANSGAISNVYGSEKGTLVGSGKLVGSGSDTVSNVYDSENDTFGDGGSAIDKKGGASASTTPWRQYGDNNPILKVFLTTVTYNPDENDQHLVYNGQDQTLNITGNGFWAADQFVAHNSVTGGLIYHDVTGEHKNAGSYMDNLWSEQIKASNTDGIFNPNHLGYDVQSVEYNIDQKELTISLKDVTHVYGTLNLKQYGFVVDGWVGKDNFSDDITLSNISDGALRDDTHTNNVGGYNWSADASIGGTLGQGGAGNYKLSTNTNLTGKSTVTKADLNITAGGDTIYVGGTPQFSGTANAFVNGDSFQLDFGMSADNANLPQTAGTYDGVVGFWYKGTFYGTQAAVDGATDLFGGNYKVTFRPGTLTVLDLPEGMPDISDIPSIERHWNFLFDDNPWDRNRDFRERKAEVHFVAGGMTL